MRHNILDKGYVELQDVMGDDNAVVAAARVSLLGESKGEDADRKLIRYLMREQHTSPFEQVEFKFRVNAPLFVVRQWQRHRTWSYNEVSRRYTSVGLEFYHPATWRKQAESNRQASDEPLLDVEAVVSLDIALDKHVASSVNLYNAMLDAGVAREQARIVLPQNMYVQFIAKVDAHNLMHFIKLRLGKGAQGEIVEYAQALLSIMEDVLPVTTRYFKKLHLAKE